MENTGAASKGRRVYSIGAFVASLRSLACCTLVPSTSSVDTGYPLVFYGLSAEGINDVICLLFPLGVAAAGESVPQRAPLPLRELERALVLPRGWIEGEIGFDYKSATGGWTDEGETDEWAALEWTYTTQRLGFRYGAVSNGELYWEIPFHYVQLLDTNSDAAAETFGLGDPAIGWRQQVYGRFIPTTSVALDVRLKLPTQFEPAADLSATSQTTSAIPLSTGQADLAMGAHAKQQVGMLGLQGSLGFVHRFPGPSQLDLPIGGYPEGDRFKPGSEVRAAFQPSLQFGPLSLYGTAAYRQWFSASVGRATGDLWADGSLDVVTDSDGWSFDTGGGVVLNIGHRVDISVAVGVPVRGEDAIFFPLEEISPTRGLTYSAGFALRN